MSTRVIESPRSNSLGEALETLLRSHLDRLEAILAMEQASRGQDLMHTGGSANVMRVLTAGIAVSAYAHSMGLSDATLEERVAEAVAGIRHYCQANGINYLKADAQAVAKWSEQKVERIRVCGVQ